MDEQRVKSIDGEMWVPLRDVLEMLRGRRRDAKGARIVGEGWVADIIEREFGASGVS